ncbi:MAG: hypothetical protein OCD01_04690 [Fibrobacterales bacterium]
MNTINRIKCVLILIVVLTGSAAAEGNSFVTLIKYFNEGLDASENIENDLKKYARKKNNAEILNILDRNIERQLWFSFITRINVDNPKLLSSLGSIMILSTKNYLIEMSKLNAIKEQTGDRKLKELLAVYIEHVMMVHEPMSKLAILISRSTIKKAK